MASLDMILHLDWWVYFIIVIVFFVVAFILNYVVKKINGKHHGSAVPPQMHPDRWARVSTDWKSDGTRRRGRPSTRWRKDLVNFFSNWKELAQDRDKWKEGEIFAQQWDNTDARLEERYVNLQNKISNSQQILEKRRMATSHLHNRIPLEVVIEQSNPPTLKGISVTSDKSDRNDYRTVKDRIDIKNFPNTAADLANTTNDVKPSDTEIGQQIFLGHIYNEINIVGRSKSLSEADKEDCGQETTSNKRQESKSIPSVKKMLDKQYKPIEEFRNWPVKLVVEEPKSITPDTEVNGELK